MNKETKTQKIIKLKCPWNNEYQGAAMRVLFACSAGLLRSPTGAAWAVKRMGWNARSCGVEDVALIPMSPELIMWAQRIVFVNPQNFETAVSHFRDIAVNMYVPEHGWGEKNLAALIKSKCVVLDIPDDYDYGDEYLYRCYDRVAVKIESGTPGFIDPACLPLPYKPEYTDQWIGAERVGQKEVKK